ncbi:hypothetical protein [Micromonospora sp. WMMD737]|uniref:hypothetical protein n=1 Tax=Micromonospora sp. WMMD737 TaxID=3404113 RepID=UPI003B96108A
MQHNGVEGDDEGNQRDPLVDVRDGRGVIVGHSGTIINHFGSEPDLTATALAGLRPRAAAARIVDLSRDRALVLLTAMPDRAAAAVLQALFGLNEDRTVALLAELSPDRAAELIALAQLADLADLPEAVEAMAHCQDRWREVFDAHRQAIHRCGPSQGHGYRGFTQRFANGAICWSAATGAQPTTWAIAAHHDSLGGCAGRLGFPLAPMEKALPSPSGTLGTLQRFEGSFDYGDGTRARQHAADGAAIYWAPQHGAHAVWGRIGEFHENRGGTAGDLGFPTTDETAVGPSRSGAGARGWRQRFEGGTVYFTPETGAVRVPTEIADYHDDEGDVSGVLGFPRSPVTQAADSPQGTSGRFQRFEGEWDYPPDVADRLLGLEHGGGATVYWSREHGAHTVRAGNGLCYEQLGGTASWLGFPVSDEQDVQSTSGDRGTAQTFQGGIIFYTETHGSLPVSDPVLQAVAASVPPTVASTWAHLIVDAIGFPVSAEQLVGPSRVQLFQRGVVTTDDDRIEVWRK